MQDSKYPPYVELLLRNKGSKIQSLGFRVWFRGLGPRASEDEYIADSLTFNNTVESNGK